MKAFSDVIFESLDYGVCQLGMSKYFKSKMYARKNEKKEKEKMKRKEKKESRSKIGRK